MSLGRFTPLGWTRGLLVILAGLVVSFFLFGFFNPYWRVADQDILLVFDAFLQNDGLPRQIDFHPAHLIVAMLSATYRSLHGLGLLETYSLSTMPLASDVAAFTRSWTIAVQIARLLCLLIVLAYVTAFAFLLRALVKDWRRGAAADICDCIFRRDCDVGAFGQARTSFRCAVRHCLARLADFSAFPAHGDTADADRYRRFFRN